MDKNIEKENTNHEVSKEIKFSSIHKLNSEWTLWYASRKENVHKIPYTERLQEIGKFSSIEEFFQLYMYLKSASEIERNTDFALFKEGFKPLWESCPNSGIWFIRFKKNEDPQEIDIKWEKLIFSLLGEQFDEPNMLGALLSIRGRESIIEVWFKYNNDDVVKENILKNLNSIVEIDHTNLFYFKDNQISLKDKSTIKHAEIYNFKNKNRKNTYY